MSGLEKAVRVLADQLEQTQGELHETKLRVVASEVALLCIARAVIGSCPEAAGLREAWDQEVASMWAGSTPMLGDGQPNPVAAPLKRLLEMIESAFPT